MSLNNIPISNTEANYSITLEMDNVTFVFEFRYNYRSTIWMLNILDAESNPLYMGLPIQVQQDVTKQVRAYDIPQGEMPCFNFLNEVEEPTRENFSEDVVLLYNTVN